MSSKPELYRDPRQGKVAGVCAGVAEYFGWETWLVRIITVTGFLLSGSFFLVAYLAGWFILEKKPQGLITGHSHSAVTSKEAEILDRSIEVKAKVWQAGEPPKQALHDIVDKFDQVESRLRNMERFVTSPQYTVSREINNL